MTENRVFDNVKLEKDVALGEFVIVGSKRRRLSVKYERDLEELARVPANVTIGSRTWIGNHVVIYEGVRLGPDCYVDDFVRVGAFTSIGEGSMLLYGVSIYENVTIGTNCRIAGFVPGNVVIGDDVTMMGWIAHKYDRPLDWSRTEPSPVFQDDVVVGINSTIVGGINIGTGAYIAAGATVTKDVPPNSLVLNTNEILTVAEFESRKMRGAS